MMIVDTMVNNSIFGRSSICILCNFRTLFIYCAVLHLIIHLHPDIGKYDVHCFVTDAHRKRDKFSICPCGPFDEKHTKFFQFPGTHTDRL